MVQFQVWTRALYLELSISNIFWKPPLLIPRAEGSMLLRNNTQRIKETARNGTYQNAAFWTHMSFFTTLLRVTSVMAPASFFLSSTFMFLVIGASCTMMSVTAPLAFTTVIALASSGFLAT